MKKTIILLFLLLLLVNTGCSSSDSTGELEKQELTEQETEVQESENLVENTYQEKEIYIKLENDLAESLEEVIVEDSELTFYDMNGDPVAYSEDGEYIYLFEGKPVAYFNDNTIYNFDGKQLGWYEAGCVLDLQGEHVFFTEDASSSILKLLKGLKPLKGVKELKPLKGLKELKKLKPLKINSWSDLSGEKFFE